MKRLLFFLSCLFASLTVATYALPAQSDDDGLRSEQFILDSLQIEARKYMYADSLNNAYNMGLLQRQSNSSVFDDKVIIPIVFFATVVLIVLVPLLFSYLKKRSRYKVIERAIDAGQPVPETLFVSEDNTSRQNLSPLRTLRTAIILLSFAVGGFILAYITRTAEVVAIAAVPLLIGIGYIIVYALEKRADNASQQDNNAKLHENEQQGI